MKAVWLGEGGLYFETSHGCRIMIDPYLSDSIEKANGPEARRLVPIDEAYGTKQIDVLVVSHCHEDHMDLETLDRLLSAQQVPVTTLSPQSVWSVIRDRYRGVHNHVLFSPDVEYTARDAVLRSVRAVHSDERAIGVVMTADGLIVYVTGDTLYSRQVLESLATRVDYLFVVVSGRGNNMNCADAARFAQAVAPRFAVPIHWDMFEGFTADPREFEALLKGRGIRPLVLRQFQPVELA